MRLEYGRFFYFIMEEEIWKDVVDYEGFYLVSSLGRIKNITPRTYRDKVFPSKGRITSGCLKNNYTTAGLTKHKKENVFLVHRLVAIAFIPNPENKRCVNHINGIKHDNRLENLEWCTYSENMNHSFNNGLHKALKGSENHKSRKVINTVTGEIYESIKEASLLTKYTSSHFCQILNGKQKNRTVFKIYE